MRPLATVVASVRHNRVLLLHINGRTDRDAVWDVVVDSVGPNKPCIR